MQGIAGMLARLPGLGGVDSSTATALLMCLLWSISQLVKLSSPGKPFPSNVWSRDSNAIVWTLDSVMSTTTSIN